MLTSAAVEYVVGLSVGPMPIPDHEVSAIRRTVEAGGRPFPYLQTGQRVRVEVGPLAGVEGILSRQATKNRLVVSVNLLQRAVALHISAEEVRPLPPIGR